MKIFISGSSGFIGNNLSRYLSTDKGIKVLIPEGSWKSQYDSRYSINITNWKEINSYFYRHRVELFINSAIRKGSDFCDLDLKDAYETNIIGMMNVIKICNKYNIPLIHFGTTSYYYSSDSKKIITEDSLRAPQNFYALSKLMQEHMIKAYLKTNYMIIEPVFLYGNLNLYSSGRMESVPDIIVSLLKNENLLEEVKIDPQYIKDYTHIKDFLWIMEKIIYNPIWNRRILVGAGYNHSLLDILSSEQFSTLAYRLKFLKELDYKKNQIHSYDLLNSLYPEWKELNKISLLEYINNLGG